MITETKTGYNAADSFINNLIKITASSFSKSLKHFKYISIYILRSISIEYDFSITTYLMSDGGFTSFDDL